MASGDSDEVGGRSTAVRHRLETIGDAHPGRSGRWIADQLRDTVRVDTRSLAVFRVFIGLLVIADILLRSRNFSFYYTDDGVVTQELAQLYAPDGAVSVYYLTSDSTVIAALFVAQVLIAIALIVGFKTRIAMILTFIGVISLDFHNPLVLSYADILFRLLCFWAIFLPLGERWSIDAVHRDHSPRRSFAGIASALILGQMVYMYLRNGYHKSNDETGLWQSGDAAPHVFGIDEMTYLLGDTMREFLPLIGIGGLMWYYMMLLSPLLLVFRGRLRYCFASLFVGGHLMFILTVRIGAFGYVAIAGLTLFFGAQFWRDSERILEALGLDSRVDRARIRLTESGRSAARRVPAITIDEEFYREFRSALYTVGLGFVVLGLVIGAVASGFAYADVSNAPMDIDERFDHAEDRVHATQASIGVEQPDWGVFAPVPRSTDRYYVFPAETAGGDFVDVYNERPLSYDRPYDELQKQHSTYRERFYMNSIRRAGDDGKAPALLAEHICETWPEEHGQELVRINMYEIIENITLETVDAPEERDRYEFHRSSHACGDNEPGEIVTPDQIDDVEIPDSLEEIESPAGFAAPVETDQLRSVEPDQLQTAEPDQLQPVDHDQFRAVN